MGIYVYSYHGKALEYGREACPDKRPYVLSLRSFPQSIRRRLCRLHAHWTNSLYNFTIVFLYERFFFNIDTFLRRPNTDLREIFELNGCAGILVVFFFWFSNREFFLFLIFFGGLNSPPPRRRRKQGIPGSMPRWWASPPRARTHLPPRHSQTFSLSLSLSLSLCFSRSACVWSST